MIDLLHGPMERTQAHRVLKQILDRARMPLEPDRKKRNSDSPGLHSSLANNSNHGRGRGCYNNSNPEDRLGAQSSLCDLLAPAEAGACGSY
jgi:hypothetical protein